MYITSTNSTNTLLKDLLARGEWQEGERFLRAGYQTAGRGQTGNGWESEEGKNLLCSVLIPTRENLFEQNVLVSVAVHRTLESIRPQRSGLCALNEVLSIKWPNDIYWGDKKMAGILIENAIIGSEIRYSVAGIGLNINQTEWRSDAPNPVSLKQITGQTYDLDELMERLMTEIDEGVRATGYGLWDYYKAHLYRREGFWPFVEREVSTAPTMNAQADENAFLARIKDVLPNGQILLEDRQGHERQYHFKQVRYVI